MDNDCYTGLAATAPFTAIGVHAIWARSRKWLRGGQSIKEFIRDRTIELELPRAIAHEIWIEYQPVVRVSDRAIAGVEALARWRFAADIFVPVAERRGLTFALFQRIASEAIAQLSEWETQGLVTDEFWMSINVAPNDVVREAFIPVLQRLLDMNAIAPAQIGIEITERGVAENVAQFDAVLNALSDLRFGLEWDDFGAGDRGLPGLIYTKFDTLKLDKRLQVDLSASPELRERQEQLLGAIAQLAQKLNLDTIAEGVESEEQLAIVQRHGITYVQGYLFYRPMRAEVLEKLLDS